MEKSQELIGILQAPAEQQAAELADAVLIEQVNQSFDAEE